MPTTYLTEFITVDVQDVCGDGVYLRWVNDYGGVDTWYFSGNKAELPAVENTQYSQKWIDDLLTETENFEVLSKEYKENIRVFTTFRKGNSEGFKQMIRSRQIEMLADFDNDTWVRVDVTVESFTVEKQGAYGKIAIQIVLPETYLK